MRRRWPNGRRRAVRCSGCASPVTDWSATASNRCANCSATRSSPSNSRVRSQSDHSVLTEQRDDASVRARHRVLPGEAHRVIRGRGAARAPYPVAMRRQADAPRRRFGTVLNPARPVAAVLVAATLVASSDDLGCRPCRGSGCPVGRGVRRRHRAGRRASGRAGGRDGGRDVALPPAVEESMAASPRSRFVDVDTAALLAELAGDGVTFQLFDDVAVVFDDRGELTVGVDGNATWSGTTATATATLSFADDGVRGASRPPTRRTRSFRSPAPPTSCSRRAGRSRRPRNRSSRRPSRPGRATRPARPAQSRLIRSCPDRPRWPASSPCRWPPTTMRPSSACSPCSTTSRVPTSVATPTRWPSSAPRSTRSTWPTRDPVSIW